jgi:hypothetical protein
MILVPYEKYQRLLEKEIMDEGVSRPSAIIKKKKHHTMHTRMTLRTKIVPLSGLFP